MNMLTRLLLVIAHPDDEAMFFVPAIRTVAAIPNSQLHLLCLSNGNADGLGLIREQELSKSAEALGFHRVQCVNTPELQDGMQTVWPLTKVSQIVQTYAEQAGLLTSEMQSPSRLIVLTFDERGVSGHPNHIAVSRGVSQWLSQLDKSTVRSANALAADIYLFHLVSAPLYLKYYGKFTYGLWSSFWRGPTQGLTTDVAVALPDAPIAADSAMRLHSSQWVWFRKLSVVFSIYSHVSPLKLRWRSGVSRSRIGR